MVEERYCLNLVTWNSAFKLIVCSQRVLKFQVSEGFNNSVRHLTVGKFPTHRDYKQEHKKQLMLRFFMEICCFKLKLCNIWRDLKVQVEIFVGNGFLFVMGFKALKQCWATYFWWKTFVHRRTSICQGTSVYRGTF